MSLQSLNPDAPEFVPLRQAPTRARDPPSECTEPDEGADKPLELQIKELISLVIFTDSPTLKKIYEILAFVGRHGSVDAFLAQMLAAVLPLSASEKKRSGEVVAILYFRLEDAHVKARFQSQYRALLAGYYAECVRIIEQSGQITQSIQAPHSVQPLQVPYSIQPLQARHSVQPLQAPHSVQPLQAPYSIQPLQAPHSVQPLQAPHSVQPVQAPHSVQALQAPHSVQLLQAPHSVQPLQAPHSVQPLQAPQSVQPLQALHSVQAPESAERVDFLVNFLQLLAVYYTQTLYRDVASVALLLELLGKVLSACGGGSARLVLESLRITHALTDLLVVDLDKLSSPCELPLRDERVCPASAADRLYQLIREKIVNRFFGTFSRDCLDAAVGVIEERARAFGRHKASLQERGDTPFEQC